MHLNYCVGVGRAICVSGVGRAICVPGVGRAICVPGAFYRNQVV